MNPNNSFCGSSARQEKSKNNIKRKIKIEPEEIEKRIKIEPTDPVFDPMNLNIKVEPESDEEEDDVVLAAVPSAVPAAALDAAPSSALLHNIYDWLRKTSSFDDFMSVIYGKASKTDESILKSVFNLMEGTILVSQEMYPYDHFKHQLKYKSADVWVWTIQIKSESLPKNYTIQFINPSELLKPVTDTPFKATRLTRYDNSAFVLYDQKQFQSVYEHCSILFPRMTHFLTVFADNYHVHPKVDDCDELHIRNARMSSGMRMEHFVGTLQHVDINRLKKIFIEDNLRLEFNDFPQIYNMDHLWFIDARWVTGADLCRMKNKELYIMKASLTDKDINEYIKLWQSGKNDKLMQVCIDYDRKESSDLWNGLGLTLDLCPEYVSNTEVWFEGVYEIRKNDLKTEIFKQIQDHKREKSATIFFSNTKIHMMVYDKTTSLPKQK